jgi:thimet oligopeptidase
LKVSYTPEDLTQICNSAQKKLLDRLGDVAKIPPEKTTAENSLLFLEKTLTEFAENVSLAIFMKDVATDSKVRDASMACSETVSKLLVDIYAREDLYLPLKSLEQRKVPLDAPEMKLLTEYLKEFRRNGLELTPEKRALLVKKRQQLVELAERFDKRIKEVRAPMRFSKEEVAGLPDHFMKSLKKDGDFYEVPLTKPAFFTFMENAKNEGARKKFDLLFYNIGGDENRKDLEEAIKIRSECAQLLGYKTHADFVLDDTMAKTPKAALDGFLKPLIAKLKIKGKEDIAELLALKKKDFPKDKKVTLNSWDWRYYENQLRKSKYHVDNQAIKEYFPLDTVLKGMFEIYQTLLGVKFEEIKDAPKWHDSVQAYRIIRNGKTTAFFYVDLFPRDGKYNHAAAFVLTRGFQKDNGDYNPPASAIVANMTPPDKETPSLLEHSEVETLFHEFGHIMHQTLTTAKYATFSGTSVKRDFVEAPSQMLENWVWEIDTLPSMSGFYKDRSKKLPAEQIQRLVEAKLLGAGLAYLRQASFATIDLTYHTSAKVDSTKIYKDTTKEIMMIPIQDGTLPQASFGHLMGGYDAGYYGYLWSEVYAADMFTRFKKEGLLNPATGQDYVKWILEPGGSKEPAELIVGFLKREPNQRAFLASIGLADSDVAVKSKK